MPDELNTMVNCDRQDAENTLTVETVSTIYQTMLRLIGLKRLTTARDSATRTFLIRVVRLDKDEEPGWLAIAKQNIEVKPRSLAAKPGDSEAVTFSVE